MMERIECGQWILFSFIGNDQETKREDQENEKKVTRKKRNKKNKFQRRENMWKVVVTVSGGKEKKKTHENFIKLTFHSRWQTVLGIQTKQRIHSLSLSPLAAGTNSSLIILRISIGLRRRPLAAALNSMMSV